MNDKSRKYFGLIRDYLTIYLPEQKAYSSNTVKAYKETLSLLTSFISEFTGTEYGKVSFEHLSRKNVEEFLSWLENARKCSVSTRNQRLSGVRAFVKYAAERNIELWAYHQDLKVIPVKKIVKPDEIKYFSESALKTILQMPDALTPRGLRDLLFMTLLYDTGARNQEILDVTVSDLHLEENPYVIITGKGGKTRLVPLMQRTVALCKRYLEKTHRDWVASDSLFFTVRKGIKVPMSPDNTEKFIRKYGDRARQINPDVPSGLHAHMFRHSRAIHLYRNGMPLELVSEWLGHAHLETTLLYYANANITMKRNAIDKATSQISVLRNQEIVIDWENDEMLIRRLYGLA